MKRMDWKELGLDILVDIAAGLLIAIGVYNFALNADLPTSAIFFPSAEPAIAGTADPRIIAPQRIALTIFLFMFFSSHGII